MYQKGLTNLNYKTYTYVHLLSQMSHDLFAAFGSPPVATNLSDQNGFPRSGVDVVPQPANPSPVVDPSKPIDYGEVTGAEDDDDFGDFEDASTPGHLPLPAAPRTSSQADKVNKESDSIAKRSKSIPATSLPSNGSPSVPPKSSPEVGRHPFAGHMDLLFAADEDEYDAGGDEITDLSNNPGAAMAYSKRVIAAHQADQEVRPAESPCAKPPVQPQGPNKLWKKSEDVPARNEEVLFDADEALKDEHENEFGDFTTQSGGSQIHTNPTQLPAMDLLALDDAFTQQNLDKNIINGKPTLASSSSSIPNPTPEEEAWDDFEEAPTSSSATQMQKNSATPTLLDNLAFQHSTTSTASRPASADSMPPTNVPPPVVLLSLFPSIFASGQEALLNPLAKLDFKQRQILLAHPATQMFLRGYLGLTIVLAHIIAGRRLRWKRDQYLAQGMRIGPAAAGGKGGMKLVGVDKSEIAKEDRETLDALRVWKGQVGKLRTAVVAASATMPDGEGKLPPVPEIAEHMPIKTLRPAEGGVTSPHSCALCGLKREERVGKVDVGVNDSFGEWWVDSMSMHVLCRSFWDEHQGKLKSR